LTQKEVELTKLKEEKENVKIEFKVYILYIISRNSSPNHHRKKLKNCKV
jgi:hypothetical protein